MSNVEEGKTYKITNAKGGTVLDLSGGQDGSPITGYDFHGADNQRWKLERNNEYFRLKNDATGLYVGFDGEPTNSTRIIATSDPADWDIRPDDQDESFLRVFLAGTRYCLDLSDHGNSNPGTPVTLWMKWEGTNQTWRFEEV